MRSLYAFNYSYRNFNTFAYRCTTKLALQRRMGLWTKRSYKHYPNYPSCPLSSRKDLGRI